MGHRQAIHISKYTKKYSSTISCLNLNKVSFLQLTILYWNVYIDVGYVVEFVESR